MDRLDAMRIFVRVVERSSFVRAAEDIGIPASTTSEAVKQLERRLGVRLLERSTRQVRATVDGDTYYRHCLAVLASIEDAESAVGGRNPRGQLKVGVMGVQARQIILPALPGFLARYPELRVHLNEDDRYIDLVREGIDCVIRSGNIGQSGLVGKQLAFVAQVTVAAPDYLDRTGTPTRLAELDGHSMVGFHSTATGSVLPLEFGIEGEIRTIALPTQLTVSGVETLQEAALKGFGIVQLPYYAVAADIKSGRLVEILNKSPPPGMPVHVLYPKTAQMSVRVRVLVDWIVALYQGLAQ